MPKVQIPKKLRPVFEGKARYRGAFGGRGSAKSQSFATMILIYGMVKPLTILCAREIQNSIKDSVLKELKALVSHYGWHDRYELGVNYIKGYNGTEFIFRGLSDQTADSIKSYSQIDICWIEEADKVSERSWNFLLPTIRKPGSEIWLTWNPEREGSATDVRFKMNTPPKSKIVEMNWRDNPWFPKELEELRLYDMQTNKKKYDHIWEGGYDRDSDKMPFHNHRQCV